jgi:hypothetical protein
VGNELIPTSEKSVAGTHRNGTGYPDVGMYGIPGRATGRRITRLEKRLREKRRGLNASITPTRPSDFTAVHIWAVAAMAFICLGILEWLL